MGQTCKFADLSSPANTRTSVHSFCFLLGAVSGDLDCASSTRGGVRGHRDGYRLGGVPEGQWGAGAAPLHVSNTNRVQLLDMPPLCIFLVCPRLTPSPGGQPSGFFYLPLP